MVLECSYQVVLDIVEKDLLYDDGVDDVVGYVHRRKHPHYNGHNANQLVFHLPISWYLHAAYVTDLVKLVGC